MKVELLVGCLAHRRAETSVAQTAMMTVEQLAVLTADLMAPQKVEMMVEKTVA